MLRKELEQVYGRLAIANRGTLLGPPLMKSGTGKVDFNVELPPTADSEKLFNSMVNNGKEIKVKVSYMAHLPIKMENEAHVWEIAS